MHVVGGAVRDALLRRRTRTSSTSSSRATRSPSRSARPSGSAAAPCHERFGTATVARRRRAFDLAIARAPSATPRPGALPEVALGATLERGPRAPRLHRQRDRGRAGRRRADRRRRARWTTSTRACCACCTSARFTDDPTRMLRLARYAGRLGFAARAGDGCAARRRGRRGRLGRVTGERLGERAAAAARRAAARGAAGAGASRARPRGRCIRRYVETGSCATRVALAPADARADLAALAARCATSRARRWPRRSTRLGVPARRARLWCVAAATARRAAGPSTPASTLVAARCAASRAEAVAVAGAAGRTRPPRAAGSTTCATPARDLAATTSSPPALAGPGGRRRPRATRCAPDLRRRGARPRARSSRRRSP